jgi:hypothetical protein
MAEENKSPDVELDTDGVQEQTIDVDAPNVSNAEFEKKEEVDLGYVDVSKQEEPKQESDSSEKDIDKTFENERETKLEEKTEDEEGLKDYSDKVQKRIKKLTYQIKEAERRERAAVEYAKGLKSKYETTEQKFEETDTNYLKEYGARVDAEREQAKASLKAALESQDADKIMEANDKLTQLAVEKEKVSMSLGEKELKKKESESRPKEEAVAAQPQISRKAQEWATDNEWFGTDRVLTSAAMGIHEDLVQQGIDAETDEYYNQINKRMKEYFPQKFAQSSTEEKTKAAPVQNVASVSRRSGGRKSVKLTKSQVVIAKKLGVPLEEYAKYVKEGA